MTDHRAERPPEEFAVESFSPAPGVGGVAVHGAADLRSAPEVRAELDIAIARGTDLLLVDLTQTTFVDSSFLGVMLGTQRRLRERGGSIAVVCVNPHIVRIFELTLLDRVLAVSATLDEALARLEPLSTGDPRAAVSERTSAGLGSEQPPARTGVETIRLEIPADPAFDAVRRLVLGGIGARFDLPVDRLDELQLAVDALELHTAAAGPTAKLGVTVDPDGIRVRVGPFGQDPLADDGTRRVVDRLVDSTLTGRDEDGSWVELRVGTNPSGAESG